MEVLASRRKSQPPPPKYVFEALTQPHRDPTRPWLRLLVDEVEPRVLEAHEPVLVVWSSLWLSHPLLQTRFELEPDGAGGTQLRWSLLDETNPGPPIVTHMRKRIDQLINAHMRYSFGQ